MFFTFLLLVFNKFKLIHSRLLLVRASICSATVRMLHGLHSQTLRIITISAVVNLVLLSNAVICDDQIIFFIFCSEGIAFDFSDLVYVLCVSNNKNNNIILKVQSFDLSHKGVTQFWLSVWGCEWWSSSLHPKMFLMITLDGIL